MLPTLIAIYFFAVFSICCSCLVIVSLIRLGINSSFSKVILYLHLTQVIDVLASLPEIYNLNPGLCEFIGFLHYYSSFSNVCAGAAINFVLYRSLFSSNGFNSGSRYTEYWLEIFIFIVPLITILPFTTNSFGSTLYDDDISIKWCSVKKSSTGTAWAYSVLYSWVWLIMIISSSVFTLILYRVYRTFSELAPKLVKIFGLYPIILALSWSLRSMRRFDNFTPLNLEPCSFYNLPIYISGIFYSFIYVFKYDAWLEYESHLSPSLLSQDSTSNKLQEDEHPYHYFQ